MNKKSLWFTLCLSCALMAAVIAAGSYYISILEKQNGKKAQELVERSSKGLTEFEDLERPQVSSFTGGFVRFKTNRPDESLRWDLKCLKTSKDLSDALALNVEERVWVLNPDLCEDGDLKDGDYPVYDGRVNRVFDVKIARGELFESDLINRHLWNNPQPAFDIFKTEGDFSVPFTGEPTLGVAPCKEVKDLDKAMNSCTVSFFIRGGIQEPSREDIVSKLKQKYPNVRVDQVIAN